MDLRYANLVGVILLGLLLCVAFRYAGAEVIWHHPPDQVTVQGGGALHVVLELREQSPSELVMQFNHIPITPSTPPKVTPTGTWLHYRVQLNSGLNTLLSSWKGGRIERQVFFVIAWGKSSTVPQKFHPLVFHKLDEPRALCESCHNLQPAASDATPSSPRQSTCFSCHASITAFKQVHGPASTWSCTFCHEPNSTPSRYITPQPNVSQLCFRCHSTLKAYFDEGPYQHGPTATGRCTICHNPHATDNPFWLKRPPWYLCTSCHTEKANGRHVIAWGPSGDTHPTRGKPDPMRPHMELACNSCHNPHAAPSPKLWKFNATSLYQLCQTCHQK